jgi:DNA-directed RNA polymerase subunit K/omega
MQTDLLQAAKHRVPGTSVLINMISMRVRQLIAGQRPLLKPQKDEELEDIALREVAEGKIVAEIDFAGA